MGGTKVGAYDRMDLLSLRASNVNDGEVPSTDKDPLFAVPDGTHIWGLAHFVFVPFEEVQVILMLTLLTHTLCKTMFGFIKVKVMLYLAGFN